MNRQRITSGSPWEGPVGYSRAIRVGNVVEVAGTTAQDGDATPSGDAYSQTKRILEKIADALAEAGATMADVVRTRIYVTDIRHWEAVGKAHGEVFHAIRPASTMIEVSALIDPRLQVEIEATAIIS
ncbi:RidA family protein [Hymenobacter sp. 15J16-1T3B]|uniref:RidA family protein n=1 Tax=Hymenobacter sp. 15J16-1T3B TaxID=2886941 RepID=UPI001D106F81|nr:RidA family protein [Hymenobacter sp. 15J16-1T3B]MCC3156782.1 RidA family protein [Hymenobacter sp. 15J16-1T3B]